MITAGETALDSDLMEIRAGDLIRYKADVLFHHQVDTVRDGSECGLADNVALQDASRGIWKFLNLTTNGERCKKTDNICREHDDLGSKVDRLRKAGEALRASPDHKKIGEAALKAADVVTERKGKICYGILGDVSIALECEADEVLLTTDRSFE
jgi:hypothetical protein